MVDDVLAKNGLKRRVQLVIGHFSTAPFIVARTDLAWAGPVPVIRQAQSYIALQELKMPFKLEPFPALVSWHERSHKDPGHIWFRQELFELIERLRGG